MRFVQIEMLPSGRALVDIDKLTHAVPQEEGGTRLFLGAQTLDVPHSLDELENVLAGRDRHDAGGEGRAGFQITRTPAGDADSQPAGSSRLFHR